MFAETRTRAVLACITIAAGLTGALSLHSTELAAQSSPTVTVTPTSVAPGGTVTVTIANGPANATDWVGLYTTAAADTLMLDWKYLNGLKTAPTTGVANATVTFAPRSTAALRPWS